MISDCAHSERCCYSERCWEVSDFKKITVKFKISDTQIVAQVYPDCMTLGEVKKDIGRKFEVNPICLILRQSASPYCDDVKLKETSMDDFGVYELVLEIDSQVALPEGMKPPVLDLKVYYDKFRLADYITVHIPADEAKDGFEKIIVVEIQNRSIVKPFLGGYVDQSTGIEYLDAFTQTGPALENIKHDGIASRDTQTHDLKPKTMDTPVDATTQSFGNATNLIYVSAASDFVIIPKKYQSYAQIKRRENRLAKVILIQRNWRRYLFYEAVKRCAREYRRLMNDRAEKNNQVEELRHKRLRRECIVKAFPRTKDDFDLLYSQVQKWKEAELKRICKMYSGAARVAEVNILLDKEIQLLNGIERQRVCVRKALQDYREEQLLKQMGEPIKWVGYKDQVIEMHLLRTQRVRFLSELFKDLKKKLPKAERLDLINKVKEVLLQEDQIPAIEQIFDLFEREKNLLLFTKWCDVEVLRKRQLILFLEIIKFSKDKPAPKVENRMCDTCKCVKNIKDFALRTRQNAVDTCKRCFYLKGAVSDNSVYKAILRSIQRDERKKGSLSSHAFILQEDDIRFIVDKIWHGHSILSKENFNTDLRLPRWIKSEDWSPWNCVCLTVAEARHHYNVKDLNTTYDENVRQDILSKHILAKTAFKKLQAVEDDFTNSGQWWEVGLKQRVL